MMRAVSFWVPAITSLDWCQLGGDVPTPDRPEMALASSMVRVVADAKEPRVAEPRGKARADREQVRARALSWLLMPLGGTLATLTRRPREATPMMMPSIVSAVSAILPVPRRRRGQTRAGR